MRTPDAVSYRVAETVTLTYPDGHTDTFTICDARAYAVIRHAITHAKCNACTHSYADQEPIARRDATADS